MTLEVLHTLKVLNPDLLNDFLAHRSFLPIWEVKFFSPGKVEFRLQFDPSLLPYAPVYTGRRTDFDAFLFKQLPSDYANILTNSHVHSLGYNQHRVNVNLYNNNNSNISIHSNLVVGAEGDPSLVHRFLGKNNKKAWEHYGVGVRTFIKNDSPRQDRPALEFHFLPQTLPGYFWIFPLPNNFYNVGLFMPSKAVQSRRLNLRQILMEILCTHPTISPKFTNSHIEHAIKGWRLPLNTHHRKLVGDNYLLLGDAGALIEPFTGKGIGIGMLSAKVAAKHIEQAVTQQQYHEDFLHDYHREMYRRYYKEWLWSRRLQKMFNYPPIIHLLSRCLSLSPIHSSIHRRLNSWLAKWM